jgi:predicted SnoaL-like aldol condensation-catalyzing enzyme
MTQAADRSAAEQQNLAFVLDFWNNVFVTRKADRFHEFFAADYVDHNPNITTPGLPGLLEYVHKLSARASTSPSRGGPPHSDVVQAIVDGEFVTLIRKRDLSDPQEPSGTYEAFGFETMRVHGGKIVEHWDSVLRRGVSPPSVSAAAATTGR